jgi:hypothetical protein
VTEEEGDGGGRGPRSGGGGTEGRGGLEYKSDPRGCRHILPVAH